MSVMEEHVLTCPKCSESQNREIWHSVKEKVLSCEFNVFVCRHCGVVLQIEWPMSCHDMRGKLMIWLLPSGQSLERVTANEDETLRLFGINQGGYRKRFVHSRFPLAETVRALDHGLDDRAVALVKAICAIRKGIPADDIFYWGVQDHSVRGVVPVFSASDFQSFGCLIGYDHSAEALVDQFAPPDMGSWITVDHE